MENNEKEYLMLRTEIENNLKRQEALFLIIFTVLTVVNATNQNFWNYKILLLISALIFFLQLKILQARNTVYYLLTYMIVFLESKDSSFHWETRLYKFRNIIYVEKNQKWNKKFLYLINRIIEKIAGYMHNFVNLTLASFLFFKIIFMISTETSKIKANLAMVIASTIFILNIVYALKICFDKSLKERYLTTWNQLKAEEAKEKIKLKGGKNYV